MDLASIFVNNLEENTTEADLRDYFKDCGVIVKVLFDLLFKKRLQQELINLQGLCILTYNFKIKIKLKMLYFSMKV